MKPTDNKKRKYKNIILEIGNNNMFEGQTRGNMKIKNITTDNQKRKEQCTCGHEKERHFFGYEEHCKEIGCKCERYE